jgi:hypothetical protein
MKAEVFTMRRKDVAWISTISILWIAHFSMLFAQGCNEPSSTPVDAAPSPCDCPSVDAGALNALDVRVSDLEELVPEPSTYYFRIAVDGEEPRELESEPSSLTVIRTIEHITHDGDPVFGIHVTMVAYDRVHRSRVQIRLELSVDSAGQFIIGEGLAGAQLQMVDHSGADEGLSCLIDHGIGSDRVSGTVELEDIGERVSGRFSATFESSRCRVDVSDGRFSGRALGVATSTDYQR